MAYDFTTFDTRAEEVQNWLTKEFSVIRTGRATPALLDGIKVDSYGTKVPINQVGSVGIEDPRTLRVSVWDAGTVQAVERAIVDADLGVSVATDESGLRVIFPELTSERRAQLLKLAKAKLEDARISVRTARDESVKEIDAAQKEADLSEDERFKAKEMLQKRVEEANKKLDEMYALKEKEIHE